MHEYTYLNVFIIIGIEAEAVMLGQAISMLLPPVVGYKLVGELNQLATSTDLVLTITKVLYILSMYIVTFNNCIFYFFRN